MDPSVLTVEAMAMLDGLALAAIAGYQRWISPHKGFRCAYRAHTGRCSCSQLGARAIRRFGTFDGIGVLRERLYRCGVAFRRFGSVAPAPVPPSTSTREAVRVPPNQRGDCDVIGCIPLDAAFDVGDCLPSSDTNFRCNSTPCDVLNCGDCGGDSKKSRNEEERERQAALDAAVHLPPRRSGS